MAGNEETDSSVKVAKFVLPVIVYFPIIVLMVLLIGFVGVKILRIMQTPEGIAGYFNASFQKLFAVKEVLNKFVKTLWPGPNDPPEGKSWKHVRLDTILLFGGGAFIIFMFLLYNSDVLSSIKDNIINKLFKVINPIMKFAMPDKWHSIKRNIKHKQGNSSGKISQNYPLMIGGTALFFGFVIFMSLLVNNHNKDVKMASPEELSGKIIEKTTHYVYLSIFVGVALALFAGLLYYAATSDTAPKILSTLLIVLSTIIILSSILVMFKDRIRKYVQNPFIQVIYSFVFLLPCLFLDLVNFIYFELKRTPKVVYGILIAEIVIILTTLLIPLLTKAGYIRIFADKNKKKKIIFKIEALEHKKIRLQNNINAIKQFDPKNDVKVITINSDQTVGVLKPHPFLIPVEIEISITEHLEKFNIKKTGIAPSGKIEFAGKLNIKTDNVTWDSIQTKSNFKPSFSSINQQKKCKWYRKDKDEKWVKDFLGGEDQADKPGKENSTPTKPVEFSEIPMTLKQLKKFTTPYQYAEIEKEIIKRQKTSVMDIGNDVDVVSILTKKVNQAVEFSKQVYKKGPKISIITNKLTENAWETIVKDNLDNPENIYKLKRLLNSYGFKNERGCQAIEDHYEARKCLEEYENIIKHIQSNTKQLILFKGVIKETEEEIKNLEKMKTESNTIFEKGLIILNEPIYFRQKTYLANNKDFKEIRPETYKYNYSISCWFYIHSQPPNFKKSYNKSTEILNYNGEPMIGYNSKKNRLVIKSTRANTSPKKTNYLKTIFIKDGFKLQKWHNIVVNYVGGTVDVFLDGEIVASENRIVPFKTFNSMTVGEDSGISGGICNVIYYPSYISKTKIKSNYEYLQNKNPPTI
jgi:hypothetical protein